jgi:hypothetical protein
VDVEAADEAVRVGRAPAQLLGAALPLQAHLPLEAVRLAADEAEPAVAADVAVAVVVEALLQRQLQLQLRLRLLLRLR